MKYIRTPQQIADHEDLIVRDYAYSFGGWQLKHDLDFEDLVGIGFTSDSQAIIAFNLYGRMLIRPSNGMVETEVASPFTVDAAWWKKDGFTILGIGQYDTEWLPISTAFCGGLSRITADGWRVMSAQLVWPNEDILVLPPKANSISKSHKLWPLATGLVGIGFSPNDRYLVVASRDNLVVFSR